MVTRRTRALLLVMLWLGAMGAGTALSADEQVKQRGAGPGRSAVPAVGAADVEKILKLVGPVLPADSVINRATAGERPQQWNSTDRTGVLIAGVHAGQPFDRFPAAGLDRRAEVEEGRVRRRLLGRRAVG